MSKDPAFLFYSKDWLEGTAELMPDEKGVYIDLLCHQHQKGSLPSETERLARMVGLPHEAFLKIWNLISQNFEQTDKETEYRTDSQTVNRLVNRKLNRIMTDRAEKSRVNSITGTLAALLRYGKYSAKEYKYLKDSFVISDFLQYEKDELRERLTDWITERLKSIGNGNIYNNEINNKDRGKGERFIKPTVEEIRNYCEERKNGLDAQTFYDHYEARGWIPKGYTTQMKDWKAAVRTWEKNREKYDKNKSSYHSSDFN